MTAQAELSAARIFALFTGTNAAPPVDGPETAGGTIPDMTMSPRTPSGMPTTGLLIAFSQPTGGAVGPFDVVPWIRDPVSLTWSAGATLSGIDYRQAFVTYDFDAADLYFQFSNVVGSNGRVYLHAAEQ